MHVDRASHSSAAAAAKKWCVIASVITHQGHDVKKLNPLTFLHENARSLLIIQRHYTLIARPTSVFTDDVTDDVLIQ